jgi:hypothetical protein
MPKQVSAYDDGRVKYALDKAPQVFAEEVDHWLNKERLSFLGKPFKANDVGGAGIRGKLLGKPRFGRPGNWSKGIVGQFVSYKDDKGSLHPKITMEYARNSPMLPAMQIEESGGTTQSSKFMPIPIFQSLAQMGITKNFHTNFKSLAADDKLVPIRANGRPDLLYWIYKIKGHLAMNKLMFIGRKHNTIKSQFDFHRAWGRREAQALSRGQQAVYRATRKVERMIKEGKISG